MENTVLKFGKHKAQEITAVMQTDPKYITWLTQQAWFAEKNPVIYNVVNNINTEESSCTPEHNALQARFLDDEYILKIVNKYIYDDLYKTTVMGRDAAEALALAIKAGQPEPEEFQAQMLGDWSSKRKSISRIERMGRYGGGRK